MKKIKIIIFMFLSFIMPLSVFAYSNEVILGGKSIGINIKTDGILVVGYYKINGKFNKGNPNIKVGDRIIKVEDEEINTIKDLTSAIEKNMTEEKVKLTVKNASKEYETTLDLIYDNGNYKTGLYVKDEITGIGTLTYVDPESKIYGALGHEIVESNTNSLIEVKTGTIFKSIIKSIDRSTNGTPGGKNAEFYSKNIYGDIKSNGYSGIYGTYSGNLENASLVPVASLSEVHKGDAYISTVLDKEEIKNYKINITDINPNNNIKSLYFEVTDEELLSKTGGIVQGMSGSPILQDNKIIGAVTHVVVSSPHNGYGISIIKMLEDGEKALD